MKFDKRYKPSVTEIMIQEEWSRTGVNQFDPSDRTAVFTIDTPPPTVSGKLHLGHVYSYSHADFFARFMRMRGYNVLYPMGYDDNGLPTERLVEKKLGIRATDISRDEFIAHCLRVSEEAELEYEYLWKRLGLSIDWRFRYRTIDRYTRRLSQLSFIDLYNKGLAYKQESPAIWCPECQTAIAQAELEDLERESEFITLEFKLASGSTIPIATTRPELLPACVAVFVHPENERFGELIGQTVQVPLFGQEVPLLGDILADPAKGTGVVMCCTFGDVTDVTWWHKHQLELVEAIDRRGEMTSNAGMLKGLSVERAREVVKTKLRTEDLIKRIEPTRQSVRVHERCDTPVEYVTAQQWFIRVMEYKDALIKAGSEVSWNPPNMQIRFQQWVENLNWDWCISRQRYYGVGFPLWYCTACGEVKLASMGQLPVDPTSQMPEDPCSCGQTDYVPDTDVMDTWATSSLTPQLVGRWLDLSGFDGQGFEPLSLRPQAHEIIRTWAFYSIVKSYHHFGKLPWRETAISGWALSPSGSAKISKSKGGGPVAPLSMIERYSADATRYWAASTGLGKDATISEERIQAGGKLVNKLWNVARFSHRFLNDYRKPEIIPDLTLADRWLLARSQQLIQQATLAMDSYDYASAKSLVEAFFWNDLADNYLEMAKKRLYAEGDPYQPAARYTLYSTILTVIKLLAPFLPHICEEIHRRLYAQKEDKLSIHRSPWPTPNESLMDAQSLMAGEMLLEIATAVRRYKSESGQALSAPITTLYIATTDDVIAELLRHAVSDLQSVSRTTTIEFVNALDNDSVLLLETDMFSLGLQM